MARFTSISNIFRTLLCSSRLPRTALPSIPDDIWLDIFSRLPADSVLQCRKVCRHWRTLTSLRCFFEMHSRRATSATTSPIYVHCDHFTDSDYPTGRHFLVFDEKKRRLKKVDWKSGSNITSLGFDHYLNSSFGGLFLFRDRCEDDYCTMYDTRYIVGSTSIIKFPRPKGKVCGLYFLPLASEYKILFHCQDHYYFLYDSKTMMWKKLNSTSYPFCPFDSSPTIVNMAMHWIIDVESVKSVEGHKTNLCTHAIMGFKMDTEEFFTLPHQEINCDNVLHHLRMELFVKDELLCLCDPRHVYDPEGVIDIWILEDYRRGVWVKRHRLSVGLFPTHNTDIIFFFDCRLYENRRLSGNSLCKILIGAVKEDELLMNWFSMGLYLVNLTQGTVKKVKDPCHVNRSYRRHLIAQ